MKKLITTFFVFVLSVSLLTLNAFAYSEYDSRNISEKEYDILIAGNPEGVDAYDISFYTIEKGDIIKVYDFYKFFGKFESDADFYNGLKDSEILYSQKSTNGLGSLFGIEEGKRVTAISVARTNDEEKLKEFEKVMNSDIYTDRENKTHKINAIYYSLGFLREALVCYETDDGLFFDLYPNTIRNETKYKSLSIKEIKYLYQECEEYYEKYEAENSSSEVGINFLSPLKAGSIDIEKMEETASNFEDNSITESTASENANVSTTESFAEENKADNPPIITVIILITILAIVTIVCTIVFIKRNKK